MNAIVQRRLRSRILSLDRATVPSSTALGSHRGWALGVVVLMLLAAAGLGLAGALWGAHSATPSAGSTAAVPSGGIPHHDLASVPLHAGPATWGLHLPAAAWLAYDHAYAAYYVVAPPSSVDIIDVWSGALAVNYTIPVGSQPFGVAVDSANGNVFVSNTGSGNVSVLHGDSAAPIASVSAGIDPMGIAYDPTNGLVYVANEGSGTVTVFNGSTLAFVKTVHVGLEPIGVAVATPSAEVFVANDGASTLSVINGTQVSATVGVGDEPYGVAYDNLTNNIYVTNQGSGNVSVLSASSLDTVASIPVENSVGELQGIAYDSGNRTLWAGAGSLYAVVLDATSESVSAYVGIDPSGVAYNPDNGDVCVTNTANQTLECISFPNYITSTPDQVTFQETGLPSGDAWSVSLLDGNGPTQNTTASWMTFAAIPCYGFQYEVGSVGTDYLPTPSLGFVSAVQGCGQSNVTVNVSFTQYPNETLGDVSFQENTLPAGLAWWVMIGGESLRGTTPFPGIINFTLPPDTYTYSVLPVPGYFASPVSGTLVVSGNTTTVEGLTFLPANSSYAVDFYEHGLPSETLWGVDVNGTSAQTTTNVASLVLANGTYSYSVLVPGGYIASPSNGTLGIAGVGLQVPITFTSGATRYTVGFNEVGLPIGTPWAVNLSGQVDGSNSSAIYSSEPNGSYGWVAYDTTLGSTTYVPTPNNGTVLVLGGAVVVDVSFAPPGPYYKVTFSETGLPTGTAWGVDFVGSTYTTDISSISASLPNGTFYFSVNGVPGYTASPASGSVTVVGGPTGVTITFSPIATTGTYVVLVTESGLPTGTAWSVTLGGAFGSSTNRTIQMFEPNGSYVLNVTPIANYTANYSTPVVVNGTSVSAAVAFSATTYPVQFLESGLPSGAQWTVTAVDRATQASTAGDSTGSALTIRLADGTYSLTATGPVGYRVSLSAATLTVNGVSPAPLPVAFTSPNPGGGSTPAGLAIPLVAEVSVITVVLASLAAAWGITSYRYSRQKAEGEAWVRELRNEASETEQNRNR